MKARFSSDPLNYHGPLRLGIAFPFMKQVFVRRIEIQTIQKHLHSPSLFLQKFHASQALEKVDIPLLIMQGENDSLCPKEGAVELHTRSESSDKVR